MNQKRLQLALTFLRIVVALLMFVHGVARIYLGIVDDFGLSSARAETAWNLAFCSSLVLSRWQFHISARINIKCN
ncbi:MAG: hypothetical protein LC768_07030 [Acidobacteria bacterium]|nr:hypothetical protein [Acidobacteriota bacterium]